MIILSRLFGRQSAGDESDRYDKRNSAVSDGRRPVTVGDLTPEALQVLMDVKKGQERADAEKRAWEEEQKQRQLKYELEKENNNQYLSDPEIFRKATLEDYNKWLLAYIKQGGRITHHYDYSCPTYDKLVVLNPGADIELFGMYGAASRNFIIPKKYSFDKYSSKFSLDHCNVYGWQNGRAVASGCCGAWVPVYSDTVDKQLLAAANSILGPHQGEIDE